MTDRAPRSRRERSDMNSPIRPWKDGMAKITVLGLAD